MAYLKHLNPGLLFHTLAPLRWEQIVYRPIRIAQFRAYRAFPSLATLWRASQAGTDVSHTCARIRSVFEDQFIHLQAAGELDKLLNNQFTYLNRTLTLPEVDWNHRYESHLWNYQFHYFSYAVACARTLKRGGDERAMRQCQRLIESWIEQARIGHSDGWDAYPISLRVVNWIYAYALIADEYHDAAFLERWRSSLYQQLAFLSQHLEYHLLANHLLKNAKALVIGGLLFADDERGQQWLEQGEQLLWREFDEQVLNDGGHYERSPMYHALCLADFLECFALLKAFKTKWEPAAERRITTKLCEMAGFLAATSYADDSLALFNDAANSDEARPLPLLDSAAKIVGYEPQTSASVFPDTGYYTWASPDGSERIIVDAGPTAVGYNQAHAHCDLLSYELRLQGQPFIVDSGVHGYGGDRFREYCRSTRAHNTVMFDGREQSEVWGTFRMGRVAEVLSAESKDDGQSWDFRASYRPYYDHNLIHQRSIQRVANGEWIVEDVRQGGEVQRTTSYIHLHPAVQVRKAGADSLAIECRMGETTYLITPFGVETSNLVMGQEAPIQGWYFPDFGISQPSPTICLESRARDGAPFGYRIIER